LFTKNQALRQLFFGELSQEIADITDITFNEFKLFLDCLIGIAPYTEENSIEIFPVAWKYQVDESLDKIYKLLTPTVLNPGVCHILNLAQHYQCIELSEKILWNFLCQNQRYRMLLEKEEYLILLSGDSLKFLLNMMEEKLGEKIDSYLLDFMCKWAVNFIEQQSSDEPIDILKCLKEFQLDGYIWNCKFESTGSMTRFFESRLGQVSFTGQDIANLLGQNLLLPKHSEWVLMSPGESITETFSLNVPFFSGYRSSVKITIGKVIFYDWLPEDLLTSPGQIKITCTLDSNTVISEHTKNYPFLTRKKNYRFYLNSNGRLASIVHCAIKYTFKFHVRILKVSHRSLQTEDNEEVNLYFTKEPPKWFDVQPRS